MTPIDLDEVAENLWDALPQHPENFSDVKDAWLAIIRKVYDEGYRAGRDRSADR